MISSIYTNIYTIFIWNTFNYKWEKTEVDHRTMKHLENTRYMI